MVFFAKEYHNYLFGLNYGHFIFKTVGTREVMYDDFLGIHTIPIFKHMLMQILH